MVIKLFVVHNRTVNKNITPIIVKRSGRRGSIVGDFFIIL